MEQVADAGTYALSGAAARLGGVPPRRHVEPPEELDHHVAGAAGAEEPEEREQPRDQQPREEPGHDHVRLVLVAVHRHGPAGLMSALPSGTARSP